MKNETYSLACRELARYRMEAELHLEEKLPSFELRREAGRTVIAAPDPVELLYGVYDLAERFGGWSFTEPGRDRFDPSAVKPLPADGMLRAAVKPPLRRRGLIQEFPFDAETPDLFDWMAKNKLNYLLVWMKYYDDLPEDLKEYAELRGIVIESGHHNFDYWIPASRYHRTHPEYFAERDGRRITPSADGNALLLSEQLCTTNPALRREIVANMLAYCEKHPEVKIIALNPNDGFGWCECETCSRLCDKTERGELYNLSEHVPKADRIYHALLAEVAALLYEKRPDLKLSFFAYVNYCSPAAGFRLTENLMVHFAPYWRCINHAIDDPECPVNAAYTRDILNWVNAKAGGEVNIYEYYMGVNFYLGLPMVHFDEMYRELRWYAAHGVDGILTQFHIGNWSAYGMNYVLMARYARGEAKEEAQEALFRQRFGRDAEKGRDFYRQLKELLLKLGRCHFPYPYSLLSRTTAGDFAEILKRAEELRSLAPGDPFRGELVTWAEYMLRFKNLFDAYHAGKLSESDLESFLDWIRSHRDSRLFVQDKFESYFGALRECLRSGREWLHFNLDWEDAYIRRQEKLFY